MENVRMIGDTASLIQLMEAARRLGVSELHHDRFFVRFRESVEPKGAALAPETGKQEATTELPEEEGEAMPSDEDLLMYATPFYVSGEEKKKMLDQQDAEEGQK